MTPFFIPGVSDEPRSLEDAYGQMRRQIELDLGHRPSRRRIQKLWTRRGNSDCVTEVGRSDPLRGGVVIGIFDMGPHQPFVVWWESDAQTADGVREVLGCNAYSVLEFDA